jgi:ParB/RepB/Spo0J family partition protein
MSEVVKLQTGYIPLNQIEENTVALRTVNRESIKYEELVDSVRVKGVLQPIRVKPSSDGHYILIDGLHRYSAAKDAGLSEILCVVDDQASEEETWEQQIIANSHRVDTKPIEYTHQLIRILSTNPTLTESDLAEKLACSRDFIKQRLSLKRITNEKIQELIEDGTIKLSNAYTLAMLPEEEQDNFIQEAISQPGNKFAAQVAERLKEIKSSTKKGEKPEKREFAPVDILRKGSEIKKVRDNVVEVAVAIIEVAKATTALEGFELGIRWVLNRDPISEQSQFEKYQADQDLKEKKKKEQQDLRAKQRAAAEEARNAVAAEAAVGVETDD